MTNVVIITIESTEISKDKLREFVERNLNIESKALKQGLNLHVKIEAQEWR